MMTSHRRGCNGRTPSDVSYVTGSIMTVTFSWQARYLVMLEDGTWCSPHCKWRFILASAVFCMLEDDTNLFWWCSCVLRQSKQIPNPKGVLVLWMGDLMEPCPLNPMSPCPHTPPCPHLPPCPLNPSSHVPMSPTRCWNHVPKPMSPSPMSPKPHVP